MVLIQICRHLLLVIYISSTIAKFNHQRHLEFNVAHNAIKSIIYIAYSYADHMAFFAII